MHPGAKIKLVWTKSWFDPAKEKKAAESLVAAGADVIGQNVDSPAAGQYAAVEGPAVGRLRQRREEVRADLVADRGGVRLGPLLPQADQGGGERQLEDRLLLRGHRRRLHGHRSLRPEGVGRDEGRDREEAGGS